MPCGKNFIGLRGFDRGFSNEIKAINCGFDASWANIKPKCECAKVVTEKVIEEFPVTCEAPKRITVDRVVSISGIDNAVFLVGDVEGGYRMNEFYNLVISDDLIGLRAFNQPAYALIKAGDLHTLAVSTADIENHPISTFLRGNQHLFGGRRANDLFELAPQDFNVEANKEDGCDPFRLFPVIRVIDPTSLNIRYITIEVRWYDCSNQFYYREVFFIVPLICPNSQTLKGANLANWDDDIRTCGEIIRIPAKATDNGALKIADKPRSCGCEHRGGFRQKINFGGFGTW